MTNVTKRSLLTLIKELPKTKSNHRKALYQCECGNVKEYYMCNVNTFHTISCGCIKKISNNKKHGLIGHPLYWIHAGIVQRCTNPKNPLYPLYGGDGVTICDEWRNDFKAFYDWCMENNWEEGLEIDKDAKGGKIYSPDNCIIATHKENSNKRRNNHFIEYGGRIQTIQQWSEEYGIDSGALRYRLRVNDWNLEKALLMQPRKQKSKKNKSP